jgi:hypothetical protein
MLRRRSPLLLLALLVLVPGASAREVVRVPVPAGTPAGSDRPYGFWGPVAAGGGLAWAQRTLGGDVLQLRLARNGVQTVAATVTRPAADQDATLGMGLDGGAGAIARRDLLIAVGGDRNTPDYAELDRLLAGPLGGPATDFDRCFDKPLAVSGTRLAYVPAGSCDAVEVVELLTGQTVARFPIDPDGGPAPAMGALSLAGDHLSWPLSRPASNGNAIISADIAHGTEAVAAGPGLIGDAVIAADGTLAFWRLDAHGSEHVIVQDPAGTIRADLPPPPSGSRRPVGFAGSTLVLHQVRQGRRELLGLAADNRLRTLVRGAEAAGASRLGRQTTGILLGVDADDGRIAWAARSCDELVLGVAAPEELPGGGLDLRGSAVCRRPTLGSRGVRLDRHGRVGVLVHCPERCTGQALVTIDALDHDRVRGTFALAAGTHRLWLHPGAATIRRLREWDRPFPARLDVQARVAGAPALLSGDLLIGRQDR